MPQQKTPTLAAIFSDVLARLAFMFTDDLPAEPPAGGEWIEASVGYRGPVEGRLVLTCTREFCTVLASNLLGTDPEDPEADTKAEDAVKEFMNIACGQYVTAIHGTEAVFCLSIPAVRPAEAPPADDGGPQQALLSVDGHLVRLRHEAGPAPAGDPAREQS